MSHCDRLQDFLDGRLARSEREDFEASLASCPSCASEVARWNSARAALESWSGTLQTSPATEEQAQQLVRALERRKENEAAAKEPRSWIPFWGFGLAAAAALAVVIFTLVKPVTPAPTAVEPLAFSVVRGGAPQALDGVVTTGQKSAVVALGPHRIGLGANSSLRIVRAARTAVRVELLRGEAAFQVMGAQVRDGFVVAVDAREVRVVGTRFLVSRDLPDALRVAVSEGVVQVSPGSRQVHAGEQLRVRQGGEVLIARRDEADARRLEELLDEREPALPPPAFVPPAPIVAADAGSPAAVVVPRPAPMPAPNASSADAGPLVDLRERYEGWQRGLAERRYLEVEASLREHLRGSPADAEAWLLLGDVMRKSAQYRKAVEAYRKAEETADPSEANHARFLAASLLQDELRDPAAAIAPLQSYLRGEAKDRPLEAEAELRLGQALLATGRQDEGRALLRQVVKDHAATDAALRANRILRENDSDPAAR